MRVLVTGGTGYLGQTIVDTLLARGHVPVLFGRRSPPPRGGVTVVTGDIRDGAALREAAVGCDAMIHAAALVSIWQPRPALFDEVNVGGLENAIDAVRRTGLRRLIYTSSFLARPPAGRSSPLAANDYQRTKAEALGRARHHQSAGSPIVIMVPGVVYGPGARTEGNLVGRLVDDHLRGRLPAIVGGSRVWSFAFAPDVALAHVIAIESESLACGEYGLGGDNVPQRTLFDWVASRSHRRPPFELPAAIAAATGWFEEQRARLFGALPLVTRGAVDIFRHDWPIDSTAAHRNLDYPVRPLADGLALTFPELAGLDPRRR